jgi:membrane protein implicated in regulation of membrane protease activity
MTSLWLLAGAIAAVLVFGLGMHLGSAVILTIVILAVLLGRGFFNRAPRRVVIVQDLETGKATYQPMDGPTRHYLATRPETKDE